MHLGSNELFQQSPGDIFNQCVRAVFFLVDHLSHMECNSVNPTYYVCFSTAVIVASTILFQGFNTANTTTTLSLLSGFVVTFIGVHLLNITREPDLPPLSADNPNHLPFDNGLMYPRMSVSGRLSQDGWPLSAGGIYPNGGHSRRGSVNVPGVDRHGFNEDESAVRLERLREVEEDDEDADETTRLRSSRDAAWSERPAAAGVKVVSIAEPIPRTSL